MRISGKLRRAFRTLAGSLGRRGAPPTSETGGTFPWEKSYPADIDWRADITPRPLPDLLDEAAAAHGDKTCISFRGRRFLYRDVADQVNRAAKGFQALGVDKGIKVGLMLPNCPYAVICYYAVLKAGGIVVNINPLYAEREIEKQVADSGLCILVTLNMKALYPKVAPLLETGARLETIVVCSMGGILRFHEKVLFKLLKRREIADIPEDDRHYSFDRLIDNDGVPEPVSIDPKNDVAVFQFTGGTTGFPKAARLTHANLYANAAQIALWANKAKAGEEKILGVLPLFHAFGMTAVMNLGVRIGAELILLPHFKTAEVLDAIERERPTIFIGVPTMFSALNAVRDIDRYDISSLEFCISGGAPLPAEIQRRFEDMTGCTLVEGYGMSETSPVIAVNPFSGDGKPGSVGLPLPGTVVTIVSMDDPDKILAVGERGEVCVTGPQVMVGYANRARDNMEIFQGGHLHTGDVGYLDEDGYLFIVDRIKDLILSGGFNVYPRMVEEAVHLHPAVDEVAVCGVADPHRGEIVKAFVKLKQGEEVSAAELRAFLKDKLAPFQMPRRIEFRETLPMTLIGKISKKDLLAEEAAAPKETKTVPPPENEGL
ncbi:MAG: long-chain fatty acid--CoA ligase [Proteobacteria bacterium]|nr:long-chain fatty acid--CoA ligase [Pseudomonadota bacterium]